jgi:inner membrane protein
MPDAHTPATPPAWFPFNLRRLSTVMKLAAIGFLMLVLLIPLAMVDSVLRERLQRRDTAVREMTASWGLEQVIVGPVLVVPYRYVQRTWKDQVVNGRSERTETIQPLTERAYFLPAVLKADGRLDPSRLSRGIYESVVYRGTVTLSGHFARPAFDEWKVDAQDVMWNDAEITVAVSDLRGAGQALTVVIGGTAVQLKPGSRLDGFASGVHARLAGLKDRAGDVPFELTLTFNGSRSLRFAPLGTSTNVTMASTWPDPSFQGAFLPGRREISGQGFTARWQISEYGRSYSQQWTDTHAVPASAINSSLFGVDLVPALDAYRYVERSIKYGVLVIALVFTAFFLVEILGNVRIHPFQYTLVGAALCLFYLGLLALSEVLSFDAAYWAGAAAATLMISLYAVKALASQRRALAAAAGLGTVYGFVFVVLRLQDFSLLIGTAGLTLALALVMYVTRNIDWYARDSG